MAMTVQNLCETLSLQVLAGSSGLDQEVACGYVGDLLSWVMGRAEEGSVWLTVMGNVNVVAVAKLADIHCIVLCEGAPLDDEARLQADRNGIPVLASEEPAFSLAARVHALLAEAR